MLISSYFYFFRPGGNVGRDENPFSFRHFLRRAQNFPTVINTQPCDQPKLDEEFEARRFGGARPKTSCKFGPNVRRSQNSGESELKSPCGLPDFVQDHLVLETESQNGMHSNGFHPILKQNHNSRSQSPIHAAGAMPIPLDLANLAMLNVEDDQERLGMLDLANLNASSAADEQQHNEEPPRAEPNVQEINNNENINNLSQLPDFLSDGPMLQSGRLNQLHQHHPINQIAPEPNESVGMPPILPHDAILSEENARLRQQLEHSMSNERLALAR